MRRSRRAAMRPGHHQQALDPQAFHLITDTKEWFDTLVQWIPPHSSGLIAKVRRLRTGLTRYKTVRQNDLSEAREEHIMTAITIRIAGAVVTEQRQEPFTACTARIGSLEHGSSGSSAEVQRREHWEARSDEERQGRIESLQQYVCELLIKNQQLRMALMATIDPERRMHDAGNIQGR